MVFSRLAKYTGVVKGVQKSSTEFGTEAVINNKDALIFNMMVNEENPECNWDQSGEVDGENLLTFTKSMETECHILRFEKKSD